MFDILNFFYPKINSVFKRDSQKVIVPWNYTQDEFYYLENNNWVAHEKVDGANTRLVYNGNIHLLGRNNSSIVQSNVSEALNHYLDSNFTSRVEDVFKDKKVVFFGEAYGKGVATGKKYGTNIRFVLFDIYVFNPSENKGWWLKEKDKNEIAKSLDLDVVPLLFKGALPDLIRIVEKCNLNSTWGNFLSEGLIIQPEVPLFTRNGERIITKLKHRDWFEYNIKKGKNEL